MAQPTLNDGTSGDVVIRSGPPASGGGGGGGSSGGGNRVGASGVTSGPSKSTKEARKRAKEEYYRKKDEEKAQAQAAAVRAREEARLYARNQLLAQFTQRQNVIRAGIDANFAAKAGQLAPSLENEIAAARRPPSSDSNERWQLYLITKAKNEIDGLIARKSEALNNQNAVARSFDGNDPLSRTSDDYLTRLGQFGDALQGAHQLWEAAYSAAHEARLLSAQIDALNLKSRALGLHHAEQTIVSREREAIWEQQRQYAEQREARIRFKQQADADLRLERVRQANTVRLPADQQALSAGVLPGYGGEGADGQKLVVAVTRAVIAIGVTFTPAQAVVFIGGMLYPNNSLGNGELTPEQRHRLFQSVAVPANTLDLHNHQELQTAADSGGSVQSEYRLKPMATSEGTVIVVAGTGGDVDSRVPVVNATLDPLTGIYTAEIPGAPTRYVEFAPEVGSPATTATQSVLSFTDAQEVPTGVDWRIQDCIVCLPGLEPVYLSFSVPAMGAGVVTGTGQPATADWWNAANLAQGAAIPGQIGDQFQGRAFGTFEAFDKALWQTVGEHNLLASAFDEVNKKRIAQGFAPYAPKSTWLGEHREYELRYEERAEFWSDPFNLDKIRIKAPNAAEGWLGIVPTVVPWPVPPASSWKPLVPPGAEQLGSTTSPITPIDPLIYPGTPAIPVGPPNETFPAVDEGEVGASIPGYPGDMELPSPGLVFVGPPVEPLEVGPYNELSGRSRGDGLDIDHIPSRRALEAYMELRLPAANKRERADILNRTPSIAIPAEVHRRFSETYGGRNQVSKQLNDAADLRGAVNNNFDAIKVGLLEKGFDEKDIEVARLKLHELHIEQGWY